MCRGSPIRRVTRSSSPRPSRPGLHAGGGKAQLDLDKTAFDRTVQEFGTAIQGARVALFYYAGHGVQVRGANYLVPVSANPTKEADVDFQLVNADLVLRQMEGAGTRLNLLILDACRNNPFAGRGVRATGGGLAQMQAPEGTLISYATQPGNVAQDGTDGHSPYTRALASALRKPGLDVFAVFNETGLDVKKRTGGAQQPWVSSSPLEGKFYFAGGPPLPPTMPTSPGSPPASASMAALPAAQGARVAAPSTRAPTPSPKRQNDAVAGGSQGDDRDARFLSGRLERTCQGQGPPLRNPSAARRAGGAGPHDRAHVATRRFWHSRCREDGRERSTMSAISTPRALGGLRIGVCRPWRKPCR